VAAAARRLEALKLPVQTGGAAGTLAAGTVLTAGSQLSPFDLSDRLAAELGLAPVPAPWHTNRLAVTSLGDALAAVTDAAGKIAADVLFLSRPEVAELAEPRAAGRGVSSAMPQKQNPVLSVLVRSAALQAPQLAAQLHLAAANFNDERPDGAWHSEWPALRQLLRLALGAAGQLRELAEGLQVFPDAMRRNLELSGPLLLSEGVGAAVAPLLGPNGKQRLQAVVDQTLQAPAAEQATTYRRLLRAAVPAELLSDARLGELLDPANYLGQAAEISRRILAAYPGYASGTAANFSPTLHLNGASRG
jgi:3-carboxy-cis,cis-muconate cycloisomerase